MDFSEDYTAQSKSGLETRRQLMVRAAVTAIAVTCSTGTLKVKDTFEKGQKRRSRPWQDTHLSIRTACENPLQPAMGAMNLTTRRAEVECLPCKPSTRVQGVQRVPLFESHS